MITIDTIVSPSFANQTYDILTQHTNNIHTTLTQSAKHRSLVIDDEIDGDMDPNLEEPLKAKLKQMPSRQGAK